MAILEMVHSHILEGDLLLLLKREATGVLEQLKDSKFGGYKSYNPLAARQASEQVMALVTPRVAWLRQVPQGYLSYLLNRQQLC